MKLKHLIWAGTLAYAGYKLYQQRDTIKRQAIETKALADDVTQQVSAIQKNISTITSSLPTLTHLSTDLSEKVQSFQEDLDKHIQSMPLVNPKN